MPDGKKLSAFSQEMNTQKVRTQVHYAVSQICDKDIVEFNWLESLWK